MHRAATVARSPSLLLQLVARHPCLRLRSRQALTCWLVTCIAVSTAAGDQTCEINTCRAAFAPQSMKEASLGKWETPISSELIVSKGIGLGSPVISPSGELFWTEGRPQEGGRQVLVRSRANGQAEDVTPGPDSGFNIRTRVHEYGGTAFVLGSDVVYFVNFKDQRLYKQAVGDSPSKPEPLTSADSKQRFADGVLDARRNRLIAVCEDHSDNGEAKNTVSAVDLQSGHVTTLASGHDFYAAPRLSPDGRRLAWVCWDHPNMPWDDTELWTADVVEDGSLQDRQQVSGGKDESVSQPTWTPDGQLLFISDSLGAPGWWNICIQRKPGSKAEAVVKQEAEFAGPAWMLGGQSYVVLPDGRLLAKYSDPKRAGGQLAVIDPASGSLRDLKTKYSSFGNVQAAEVNGRLLIATTGGSSQQPSEAAVLEVDGVDALLQSSPDGWRALRRSTTVTIDEGYLSEPQSIEYATTNNQTAFMNFYPPTNKDFKLPPGEKPPLLVKIHGGPTSQASTAFNMGIQYWTSRGFAVADVNYGGSTGYGRQYRNRLRGNWGVVDVDDCCAAAQHLATQGLVDQHRLCIDGGSAGGYTTLACLAFRSVFSAGASHYGVADVELLAKETHKFESRYMDSLMGPYPEALELYKERSPIHHLDDLTAPTAFFQGTEDQVVPPNQAEIMYRELERRGVVTSLTMFEGEQHGFRNGVNIRRALDGELFFYSRALGFENSMPGDLEPIKVVNMK